MSALKLHAVYACVDNTHSLHALCEHPLEDQSRKNINHLSMDCMLVLQTPS